MKLQSFSFHFKEKRKLVELQQNKIGLLPSSNIVLISHHNVVILSKFLLYKPGLETKKKGFQFSVQIIKKKKEKKKEVLIRRR